MEIRVGAVMRGLEQIYGFYVLNIWGLEKHPPPPGVLEYNVLINPHNDL